MLNCVPCLFFTPGNETGCLQLHHLKRGLLCGYASKPWWYKMVKDKMGPPRQRPVVCLFTFNNISHYWSPEMGIVIKRISHTGKYAEKRKAKLSAEIWFLRIFLGMGTALQFPGSFWYFRCFRLIIDSMLTSHLSLKYCVLKGTWKGLSWSHV